MKLFLTASAILIAQLLFAQSLFAQTLLEPSASMLGQVARLKAKNLPLTDYHIHIRGRMTPDKALD